MEKGREVFFSLPREGECSGYELDIEFSTGPGRKRDRQDEER